MSAQQTALALVAPSARHVKTRLAGQTDWAAYGSIIGDAVAHLSVLAAPIIEVVAWVADLALGIIGAGEAVLHAREAGAVAEEKSIDAIHTILPITIHTVIFAYFLGAGPINFQRVSIVADLASSRTIADGAVALASLIGAEAAL